MSYSLASLDFCTESGLQNQKSSHIDHSAQHDWELSLASFSSLQNQGGIRAVLDLLSSLLGQVCYPIEHLAWAADNRLLPLKSRRLWVLVTMLWVVSLLVSCLRAIAMILEVNKELFHCENILHPNGKKKVTFEDQRTGSKARASALRRQRHLAVLTVVQSLFDLMNAVHGLPEGFLWAGRLPLFWVGLFGTVSSLIGLYKILPTAVHRSLSNQR